LPDAVFHVEEVGVGNRTNVNTCAISNFPGILRVVDFVELVATPTTRLAAHWPGRTSAELTAVLAEVSVPGVHCSIAAADGAWLIATPVGVTKGSALERLRVQLGVASTATLAVGDGTNDLEMLAWAAHGVAMGQAPAVVRAAADEVCPPVTEDGLATVLGRWF
jgi:hypothetical protein